MRVTRQQLEATLTELRREVSDPRLGLWGPGTMSWRVNRELVVFLAGGRAALLQLAHPFVAHAVDQHSATRHDPLGRFERTFRHVFAMSFGDLDHAVASARRVHAIHERIFGVVPDAVGPIDRATPYHANDHDALVWVYATLIDSAARAYELVVAPLTRTERDEYYRESWRFAKLFGIDTSRLPADWDGFAAYNRRMHGWLAVAEPARDMGRFLLSPAALRPAPLADWYRTITAGLLPAPLRDAFGFRFGLRERAAFAASLTALRVGHRLLPSKLRHQPTYLDAQRRLEGKAGRDRIGYLVERCVLHAAIGH
jgi:uncharacterized protein (DUF2236 family)